MKPLTSRSILDELPPEIRDILTQHAVQQEEDINNLIKKWITSTAERLNVQNPTGTIPEKPKKSTA